MAVALWALYSFTVYVDKSLKFSKSIRIIHFIKFFLVSPFVFVLVLLAPVKFLSVLRTSSSSPQGI